MMCIYIYIKISNGISQIYIYTIFTFHFYDFTEAGNVYISESIHYENFKWVSLVAQTIKNLPAMQETQVQSLGWEDPRRREWLPTPVLSGRFHGERSLVGYSPWVTKS